MTWKTLRNNIFLKIAYSGSARAIIKPEFVCSINHVIVCYVVMSWWEENSWFLYELLFPLSCHALICVQKLSTWYSKRILIQTFVSGFIMRIEFLKYRLVIDSIYIEKIWNIFISSFVYSNRLHNKELHIENHTCMQNSFYSFHTKIIETIV